MSIRGPRLSMLWQGNDTASHVTLLGSLHALSGPLPEWVASSAMTCERIVLEADPTSPEMMETPDGRSIAEKWPSLRPSFERACRMVDIDSDQLGRAWPAWAAIILGFRALGSMVEGGVEPALRRLAADRGIKPWLLELPADFVNLLSGFDEDEQVRYLQLTMRELAHSKPRFLRAEADWRSGRLQALAEKLRLDTPQPKHMRCSSSCLKSGIDFGHPGLSVTSRIPEDRGRDF